MESPKGKKGEHRRGEKRKPHAFCGIVLVISYLVIARLNEDLNVDEKRQRYSRVEMRMRFRKKHSQITRPYPSTS
jgi:hypothetical protein